MTRPLPSRAARGGLRPVPALRRADAVPPRSRVRDRLPAVRSRLCRLQRRRCRGALPHLHRRRGRRRRRDLARTGRVAAVVGPCRHLGAADSRADDRPAAPRQGHAARARIPERCPAGAAGVSWRRADVAGRRDGADGDHAADPARPELLAVRHPPPMEARSDRAARNGQDAAPGDGRRIPARDDQCDRSAISACRGRLPPGPGEAVRHQGRHQRPKTRAAF